MNMMNKVLVQCVLFFLSLGLPVAAQAQDFWGGTAKGMSPSEVLRVVEGSHRVEDGGNLSGGGKELIRLDDFVLVDKSFSVGFFFENNMLTQVSLRLNPEVRYNTGLLIFNRLSEILRSKYGTELFSEKSDDSVLKSAEMNWVDGKTNISMLLVAVADKLALLTLNYQTRISEEAEKI